MLKKLLIGISLLIAVFAIVVSTRPDTYHVERAATIAAPADVVFGIINDLHVWSEWSPWDKLDPAMQKTYEGPAAGVGASYAWSGNDQVGKGRMTVTESVPNDHVGLKLEFIEPWQSVSSVTLALKPADADKVGVTWSMDGTNNFVSKAFCMFMNMDAMIGADFEKGLANLAQISEATAKRKMAEAQAAAQAAPPAAPDVTPEAPHKKGAHSKH